MNSRGGMWPRSLDYSKPECVGLLRGLELKAYSGVLDALRAGGVLTPRKSNLLADLRKTFSISEDRHKAEVRRAINSEILNTVCEKSVFPLPPLQRDIKSPDLEDETTSGGVFVKPEPLSTAADQSLNGSVGSTCSPDKIKTEIKEESLSEVEETGMVFLPSGMAIRLSETEKPSTGTGNSTSGGATSGGRKSAGSGKRKRSVSRSIEVFPKGVPVSSTPNTNNASNYRKSTTASGGRRSSTSSPPRKFSSPLSPVHQAGHGYARPPPPVTPSVAGPDSYPHPSSLPQHMIQEYMNSAVGQQYLNSATAVGQQQVPLDLAQTPKTGKRGPGRPPGAPSPRGLGGLRTRGTRAPRGTRGSRSRGRGAAAAAINSAAAAVTQQILNAQQQILAATPTRLQQPTVSPQNSLQQRTIVAAASSGGSPQQFVYTQQQPQNASRQQILSPTQQQTSLYPSATTLKTSISRPPSSTVVSNTSKDEMNQLKHASQSTVTSTSTNTISYAAHYITTTPTKVVNLARTAAAGHSQGSGATATILTPVVSSAGGTVVRSLQGAGGNGGSQQGSVVQYQHITSHKQQVITNHQSTTQTEAAEPEEHQLRGDSAYNNINSHQTQAVNLSNKSSCTSQTLTQQPHNDLNGKGENTFTGGPSLNPGLKVDGGNMKIVNISGCISQGSQVSNLISSAPSNVQSISIVKPASSIVTQIMLPVTNTVSTSSAIGGCSGGNSQSGIKLITNAKIVPKSESHKYGGPVYIVKNAANQRVLNSRLVNMSGSGGGQNFSGTAFVTGGSNVGAAFVAASNSACSAGSGALRTVSNATSTHAILPTVFRNIRTTPGGGSSAVVSKSVIVVKPGQVVTTLQGSKPVTVGPASALGAAAGSTPIVVRGSTAGFIRAPVSLAGGARIGGSRPIVSSVVTLPTSVVTLPTFVRQHQQQQLSTNGNLVSSTVRLTSATPVVSTTSVPSSSNMYVLDVTNNVTSNNALTAVSSAAASNNSTSISLNNLDPIVHRLTNAKPVLTSKAISVATSSAPSFWLQPKVSLGSNDQLIQNSQVVVSNNSTAAALVGKLVTSISNKQQLQPQSQLVSVVNNSSSSSGVMDEEANNFSDIFSQAMEQANIPTDNSLAELEHNPTAVSAVSSSFSLPSNVFVTSSSSGIRSVTLQSRSNIDTASNLSSTNLVPNSLSSLPPEQILAPSECAEDESATAWLSAQNGGGTN